MRVIAYPSLGASLVLAGISPIFFKLALVQIKGEGLSLGAVKAFLTNKYAIIGLTFYALSSLLWLISLSDLPASLMYPLLNLAYVLTVLLASVYLKEPVHALRWIGVFLIIVGSILVGIN
ncbi:EamA family transporter [Thermococcus stetteri]|uniref:EamA family transporter n=1 Tax=Thermococcus stetteri TaxID=49900 RepID=UPI001AE44DE7|nr:EamA family transporter [Thermococcus stetteri]MBP1912638.1 drug/metabolite transporter (DMT)-like permease [Thermococcus stetteri]